MNIFQSQTKSIPTSDAQIVRVDMEQLDIGGRKSHLSSINSSSNYQANQASITHVPNADGGK